MTSSHTRGFLFLNVTQFLGAANDNILKQVLIFGVASGGIWEDVMGKGGQAWASLCLAIPFVLLSGFAGQFSDKYSKQSVSIVSKWSEILVAIIAMIGLWMANLWIVLFALFVIATQSTFFSPSKFGILPEIIEEEKLSRANGTINMFTYIAVILGGAVGGPLYDAYAPDTVKFPNAQPLYWLPGVVILIVGVAGTMASYGIPRLPAQNPKLKIKYQLFKGYISTWRHIYGSTLAAVIIAWSYFFLIVAGIAILILPDYKELLKISATETSLLMALLGVSIGVGDYTAGRISGHGIRPELIPIGTIGTASTFLALGVIPHHLVLVTALLAACGFMAGFVMVPLQTMIQQFSNVDQRGQVLGLWNCLSFVGIIVGNLIFLVIKNLGLESNRIFLVCGVMTIAFQVMYSTLWKHRFAEAIAKIHTRPEVD